MSRYLMNHWKITCKKNTGLIISAGKTVIFNFREASTKEEWCQLPKKKYLKIGKETDPKLTTKMYKSCMKSDHPNVHICDKLPGTKRARKIHKLVKSELKKLRKKNQRRKRRNGGKKRKGRTRKKSI